MNQNNPSGSSEEPVNAAQSSGIPRSSEFQYATPESEGVESGAIRRWCEKLDKLHHIHGFVLMRRGKIIAEAWKQPYAPDYPHRLYSTSKSFVSAAIGILQGEGKISVDDLLWTFFRDRVSPDELSDRMKRVRIKDLLSMSSGHASCALESVMDKAEAGGDWVRAFLKSELPYEPGTHFAYNSGATYMLSSIIRSVTGMNVSLYLKDRLFEPLGIHDVVWHQCPRGTDIGGWGLQLKLRDLAKFTELCRCGGVWKGNSLIPADYLKAASSPQSDNSMNAAADWKLGYGYQFWRSQHNCFRGDGWCGQYAFVMPDQEMSMTMNSGLNESMQLVLDALYEELLPCIHRDALPENPSELRALHQFCSSWEIPMAEPPEGGSAGFPENEADSCWSIEDNPFGIKKLSFHFDPIRSSCAMRLETAHGTELLEAGFAHRILNGRSRVADPFEGPVSASALRLDDSTLQLRGIWLETPFIIDYNCRFDGDSITVEESANLRFRTPAWTLHGKRKK